MFKSMQSRREDEKRVREEGRLPPGQSLTKKFPVLHYGPIPPFNPSTWDLRVWGEVEEETTWTWEQFNQLPRESINIDLHCVTRWSKFDTNWEGVSMNTLFEAGLLKLKPSANYLVQHAEYGFTVNIPVSVALAQNFLLATHFEGEPISADHGYPLRGIVGAVSGDEESHVPYLWKGAKWLRGLEFIENDRLGFWEQAGYHNEAGVWEEQRFSR